MHTAKSAHSRTALLLIFTIANELSLMARSRFPVLSLNRNAGLYPCSIWRFPYPRPRKRGRSTQTFRLNSGFGLVTVALAILANQFLGDDIYSQQDYLLSGHPVTGISSILFCPTGTVTPWLVKQLGLQWLSRGVPQPTVSGVGLQPKYLHGE